MRKIDVGIFATLPLVVFPHARGALKQATVTYGMEWLAPWATALIISEPLILSTVMGVVPYYLNAGYFVAVSYFGTSVFFLSNMLNSKFRERFICFEVSSA